MMKPAPRVVSVVVLGLSLTAPAISEEPGASDPWAPLRVLIGEWQGKGSGIGGESRVRHTYRFVIQDKFIHSTTLAEFQATEDGSPGEIHEDWGFFSFDSDRGRIVFRQFLSEGFVNTYVLEDHVPGSNALIFTSESSEGSGGMTARLTLSFEGDDSYKLVLELAPPGKAFFSCRSLEMELVTGE